MNLIINSIFCSKLKFFFVLILDAASIEKSRLEEKQRESRKHGGCKAKWFSLSRHPVTNEEIWLFTNKYWLRDFADCPQLY